MATVTVDREQHASRSQFRLCVLDLDFKDFLGWLARDHSRVLAQFSSCGKFFGSFGSTFAVPPSDLPRPHHFSSTFTGTSYRHRIIDSQTSCERQHICLGSRRHLNLSIHRCAKPKRNGVLFTPTSNRAIGSTILVALT